MKEEKTNEQLILEAAEKEFISKGYSGAKTTSIAQSAGVTHAMLHYYFRTKENLFQKVFQEKVHLIGSSFETVLDENLPFEAVIRSFVESHFDFVMQNGQLVNFVFNEVRANKANSLILRDILVAKMKNVFSRFEKMIEKEAAKGTIKSVKPIELLANIITLNLSTSTFLLLVGDTGLISKSGYNKAFLKQRKESNVQYILHTLKP